MTEICEVYIPDDPTKTSPLGVCPTYSNKRDTYPQVSPIRAGKRDLSA